MALDGSMSDGMLLDSMDENMLDAMGAEGGDYSGAGSLSPLPAVLRHGLPAITFLAFFSFFASLSLLAFLIWRVMTWRHKTAQPYNQFIILILNLLLADMFQSLGFLFNVEWVDKDMIDTASPTCWAQGFFLSVGDLASGMWCLSIGIHTFASVLFNKRLSQHAFYAAIFLLWCFVYGAAITQMATHPSGVYTRAGAWCWVNDRYSNIRLYTHYLWIFIAELGTVIIYASIYLVLLARIHSGYYEEAVARRAKSVATLMAIYPAVYVICTLPLASTRTAAMAGRDVSLTHLVVAGAFITSNGWLDVVLYTFTRNIIIFSHDPPSEDCGISTFKLPWECESRFGTTTTIVHDQKDDSEGKSSFFRSFSSRKHSKTASFSSMDSGVSALVEQHESMSDGVARKSDRGVANYSKKGFKEKRPCLLSGMCKGKVTKETTVQVSSAPMGEEDLKEMKAREGRGRGLAAGSVDGVINLDFQTKPSGL